MAHSFHSRPSLRCLAWALACASALFSWSSHAQAQTSGAAVVPSLVTLKQGKQIAQTALRQDESGSNAQDCSHLVHQIYSAAGYGYAYASSFDLYAGQGNFRRVKHAQSGDLIAWRGHVGIVISPRAHTFYSLVRSGLQTEDYLSPYWRSRGIPRFYRYVLDSRTAAVSTIRVSSPASPATPAISTIAEAEKAPQHKNRESIDDDEPVGIETSGVHAEAPVAGAEIPIQTQRERPSPTEVRAALSTLAEESASALRADQPLRVSTPVVIFDEIKVEKVELKRDRGWAHLKISSHVRISADGAEFKRHEEKAQWEVRRGQSGWSAIVPQEYRLVSSDAAVRALAARLAEMTQSAPASQHDQSILGEEARIANILAALLAQ